MESPDVTSMFYDAAVCIAVDLLVFVALDHISKESIRGARSAAERRRIWLYESLSLVLASCVVGYAHHRPYLLLLLALPTFVFAMFHGRSDFSRATEAVRARWNEFKEHHESLEALRQLERSRGGNSYANHVSPAQQAEFLRASAAPAIVINPQNTRPGLSPAGQLRSLRFNEQKAVYEFVGVRSSGAASGTAVGERLPTADLNTATASTAADAAAPLISAASGGKAPTVIRRAASEVPSTTALAASDVGTADAAHGLLRRRPIRTESAALSEQRTSKSEATSLAELGSSSSLAAAAAQRQSAAWAWGSRVLTALGLGRAVSAASAPGGGDGAGASGLPPGLRNPGSLCFVNAALQCLARSPELADNLAEESKGAVAPDARPTELALLDVCAELMQKINVHPAENDCTVLDHSRELREAAAELNADLFTVDKPQQQQDAAEFLTWLLSELHDVINESSSKAGAKKVLQKGYLKQLRVIYGDITARQCEQLKAACWQEISEADGLDMRTYAEAIQRLSDIEWLSYKHRNYSIIDDLFTGQMVETRVCTRCSALAVSIQPFNLLSVPLPELATEPTTLEDCLHAYGKVEVMRGGAGGARCEACVRRAAGVLPQAAAGAAPSAAASSRGINVTPPRSITPTANAAALLSPIAGGSPCSVDDSGLPVGGNFLTSTPAAQLPGGGGGRARASDGTAAIGGGPMQRRCLLRQLPDCIVLQLMRFQYDAALQQSRKVKTSVVLPLDGLDLSHIVYDAVTCRLDLTSSSESEAGGSGSSGNLGRYSLYGVCLHVGAESTACGHYVSYARAVDGQWYVFDDEMVLRVTNMAAELQTKGVRENCYLLFYRRQAGPDA